VIATLGGGPNGAAMGGTLVSFEWPRPGLPLHYLA